MIKGILFNTIMLFCILQVNAQQAIQTSVHLGVGVVSFDLGVNSLA